jgi:hypothetical protein
MNLEAITPLYKALRRYAGWLDRARPSVDVRADVVTLGTAIANGGEIASPLGGLDASIGRLPTGPLRTMLRTTAADFRRALEDRG